VFKLYGNSGAASVAPHVMLIEAGVPYEFINVDIDKGEQFDPEYRSINPHARVPTLIEGDRVMYESAAITVHLGERFPKSNLVPAPGSPERAPFLQWMAYLTNTVQETHLNYWHPEHYAETDAGRKEVSELAGRKLAGIWSHIDAVLAAGGPYLTGARCTTADIYLTMLTRWSRKLPKPPTDYPHLKKLIDLVKARPAFQAMMKAERIE
jgi:glutathione S-transferase